MTDTITILTSRGPLLTKTWRPDGTLKSYDRAKTFSVEERPVSDLRELAKILEGLAPLPTSCVIRGLFVEDQHHANRHQTTRDLERFKEIPHHWVCFDVDGFEPVLADPVSEPAEAIAEFIQAKLPLEFAGVSYAWQLSSSAGAPGKDHYLKAHIWFWLAKMTTGPALEAWARIGKIAVDKTVFRTVQVHYTAAPVFEQGVVDPVQHRAGFHAGARDAVDLVLPEDWEAWAFDAVPLPTSTKAARAMADPGLKQGLIGAFCRAYDPERCIDDLLAENFEWEDEDKIRVTWLQGGGSPGGACITDDRLHFYNSHDSDPNGGRAVNAWDMVRIYKFGHLDGEDLEALEFAGPGALPSHVAMKAFARDLAPVQIELMGAALTEDAPRAEMPAMYEDTDPLDAARQHGELVDKIIYDVLSTPTSTTATVATTATVEDDSPPAAAPLTEAQQAKIDAQLQLTKALQAIQRCPVAADLETRLAANLKDAVWSQTDRAQLTKALQDRAKALTGALVPIGIVRGWMAPSELVPGFHDVTPQGRILGTEGNVREVLRQMGATVRYNTMSKEDEILIVGRGFTVDNRANVSLGLVLSACNALDMKIQIGTLKTFINIIAEGNQYNPPLEWIQSSPWDGIDRFPAWLATISSSNEPVKEMLMRRWALQCVAILHNTGTTMARGVVTFSGAQYLGKSRWFKSLAPEGMVRIGHLLDVHSKDSVKLAIRYWITELGEVDGTFKKSDMAAVKAFISNVDDELRLPYAPVESKFPRRTAMGATVNSPDFLRDPTGSSRFWVVEALKIVFEHGIDMQQFWAQVLVEWAEGATPHWLTPDELATLNMSNEEFTTVDPLDELVRMKLAWNDPDAVWRWSTATQIAEAIGAQHDRGAVSRLGAVTRRLNGNKSRRGHGGIRLLWVPFAPDAEGDN